mgnify:CR=1 FL=1
MNYNKIVQGILDIGEAMLQSGAENFRLEDSFYRMCRSYGFKRSDVFVIPSNIQVTVETPEGEIITQIRHIESTGADYDRLNYLNALSRYVCAYNPEHCSLTAPNGPLTAIAGYFPDTFFGLYRSAASVIP